MSRYWLLCVLVLTLSASTSAQKRPLTSAICIILSTSTIPISLPTDPRLFFTLREDFLEKGKRE